MPHCIIEYAQTLEPGIQPIKLMEAVYLGSEQSELFDSSDIQVRAIPYNHFYSGNTVQPFVHVCVKIMSGRTLEQREALSSCILEALSLLFISAISPISLTVEVVEIETESYSKLVL